MGDKKLAKLANVNFKFICVSCDYKCSKQSDYIKHNLTVKHKKNSGVITEMTENSPLKYICKCGNEYFHRQGLSRHKNKCVSRYKTDEPEPKPEENNNIINLLIENNKQLQDDNKEFKDLIIQLLNQNKISQEQTKIFQEQNQEQTATILELAKNGITNNTTNNNNNKTFNIQIYLNETCKDAINIEDFIQNITISNEDLLTYAEYDYGKATTDIIVKNLKPLKNCNFPFHCSNIQDKTIYTKSLNTWLKDEGELLQSVLLNGIQQKLNQQIIKYRKAFPDCLKSRSNLSCKYLKIMTTYTANWDKSYNNKILLNLIKNIIIHIRYKRNT
jgi:hypothetical protein